RALRHRALWRLALRRLALWRLALWRLADGLGRALLASGGPAPTAPAGRPHRPRIVHTGTVSPGTVSPGTVSPGTVGDGIAVRPQSPGSSLVGPCLVRGRAVAVALIAVGARGRRLRCAAAGLLAVLAGLGLPALLRRPAIAPAPAAVGAVDKVERNDHTTTVAAFARLGEGLEQARADPLAGHLHQAERGHLGNLVFGPVPGQAFEQPPQHELPVALQYHVDEVDHDDPADVAQPQLPHDLLGGLQVVAGDGLLQIAALAGELPCVDVDDGHGLGGVDDQRAAAGEPHLAVECLGELLVDPVVGERVP